MGQQQTALSVCNSYAWPFLLLPRVDSGERMLNHRWVDSCGSKHVARASCSLGAARSCWNTSGASCHMVDRNLLQGAVVCDEGIGKKASRHILKPPCSTNQQRTTREGARREGLVSLFVQDEDLTAHFLYETVGCRVCSPKQHYLVVGDFAGLLLKSQQSVVQRCCCCCWSGGMVPMLSKRTFSLVCVRCLDLMPTPIQDYS